jgi:hypothetical protein
MNILVSSYDDGVLIPVLARLCAESGHKVVYWLASSSKDSPTFSALRSAFPDAILHRVDQSPFGEMPDTISRMPLPALDRCVLDQSSSDQLAFDRQLDYYNPDGRAFTGREKRELFYLVVQLAYYLLDTFKPALLFASGTPHSIFDLFLYSECRRRGIDVLIYSITNVPGFLLPDTDLRTANPLLLQFQRGAATAATPAVPVHPKLVAYLNSVRSDYSVGRPWYNRLRDDRLLQLRGRFDWRANPFKRGNYARELISTLSRSVRLAARFAAAPLRSYRHYFVDPLPGGIKSTDTWLFDAKPTLFRTYLNKSRSTAKKRRLLQQYRNLTRSLERGVKYVFMPLHYQPEATTIVLGGWFADQLLAIRMVAEAVPDGWQIFVKEHPTTFDPYLDGDFCRDPTYYKQILKIPKTRLVPLDLTSFDLIDGAQCVASVTGTATWEAVARGIPSIIFGRPWFAGCEGVFDGGSLDGIKAAFEKIAAGWKPTSQSAERFLAGLESVALFADRSSAEHLTDLSPEENTAAFAEHIKTSYQRLFAKNFV